MPRIALAKRSTTTYFEYASEAYLFTEAVKSEQCRAMSAYQRAQPLMSGVAVPLEHLVDRVEIRSDLLRLPSA